MTKPASEITFNLTDFKQRAARVRESLGVSEATLSKQLFNGDSKPLPNIMARKPIRDSTRCCAPTSGSQNSRRIAGDVPATRRSLHN